MRQEEGVRRQRQRVKIPGSRSGPGSGQVLQVFQVFQVQDHNVSRRVFQCRYRLVNCISKPSGGYSIVLVNQVQVS